MINDYSSEDEENDGRDAEDEQENDNSGDNEED